MTKLKTFTRIVIFPTFLEILLTENLRRETFTKQKNKQKNDFLHVNLFKITFDHIPKNPRKPYFLLINKSNRKKSTPPRLVSKVGN